MSAAAKRTPLDSAVPCLLPVTPASFLRLAAIVANYLSENPAFQGPKALGPGLTEMPNNVKSKQSSNFGTATFTRPDLSVRVQSGYKVAGDDFLLTRSVVDDGRLTCAFSGDIQIQFRRQWSQLLGRSVSPPLAGPDPDVLEASGVVVGDWMPNPFELVPAIFAFPNLFEKNSLAKRHHWHSASSPSSSLIRSTAVRSNHVLRAKDGRLPYHPQRDGILW